MKEVYCMNTRFELNIKRVNVQGDDSFLYLYFDRQLVLKLGYRDIEEAVRYLFKRSQQQQLQRNTPLTLSDEAFSSNVE